MEEEATYANRHGYSKHHPALPLYTREDVEQVFPLLQPQPYEHSFEVVRELHTTLRRAGHILGSASVELRWTASGRRLVFSGDLGRWGRPILRDPDVVSEADVLLMESTYGDRLHAADARAPGPRHQRNRSPRRRGSDSSLRRWPGPRADLDPPTA